MEKQARGNRRPGAFAIATFTALGLLLLVMSIVMLWPQHVVLPTDRIDGNVKFLRLLQAPWWYRVPLGVLLAGVALLVISAPWRKPLPKPPGRWYHW